MSVKRFENNLKRKKRKRIQRTSKSQRYLKFIEKLGGKPTLNKLMENAFSKSLKYLFFENTDNLLYYERIRAEADSYNSTIVIPNSFSIIENPKNTYAAIRKVIASCLFHKSNDVIIDYTQCKSFTIEAQILLDLILKDILKLYRLFKEANKIKKVKYSDKNICDRSINESNIRKMLFSVGSQAIHAKNQKVFPDVIPYNLCIHSAINNSNYQSEQKEKDTTLLYNYVEKCLQRMNKTITPDMKDNLCTVIGEILINAEEHSSTRCRYSIGYFEEQTINTHHIGVFQLVIMNMGKTIYEKFHDDDCPNKDIVSKMKLLSSKYTSKSLFHSSFDEETLWTLYSLQDGVTSVSRQKESGRGNGSCRFIESFLNLRSNTPYGEMSKMTLQSGKTSIIFDGKYGIRDRIVNGETYKVMTFNKSGTFEDKPDAKYVKKTDFFFPGTFIQAKIIF